MTLQPILIDKRVESSYTQELTDYIFTTDTTWAV